MTVADELQAQRDEENRTEWVLGGMEGHEGYEINYLVHRTHHNHVARIFDPSGEVCHEIEEARVQIDLQSDALAWIDDRVETEQKAVEANRLELTEIAALLRANGVAPGSTLSMVAALVEREKALRETLRAYRDEAAEASYDRHHHAGSGGY